MCVLRMVEPKPRFQSVEKTPLSAVELDEVLGSARVQADLAGCCIGLVVAWTKRDREPMTEAPVGLNDVVNGRRNAFVSFNEASHAAELPTSRDPPALLFRGGLAAWSHVSAP